jgi:hypothetical protein
VGFPFVALSGYSNGVPSLRIAPFNKSAIVRVRPVVG